MTTFPVSSGLGVSWRGTYYDADAYRLERRTDGGDWTTATTATASRQTDGYFFVDHDTAPGQHVAYRVFAVASGLDSVASHRRGNASGRSVDPDLDVDGGLPARTTTGWRTRPWSTGRTAARS